MHIMTYTGHPLRKTQGTHYERHQQEEENGTSQFNQIYQTEQFKSTNKVHVRISFLPVTITIILTKTTTKLRKHPFTVIMTNHSGNIKSGKSCILYR